MRLRIAGSYEPDSELILYQGDCLDLLAQLPDGLAKLVVTSPPYNLGKVYEQHMALDEYRESQSQVIQECVRVLGDDGSICWQVGNYVDNGEIVPLDILLYPIFADLGLHLRNRIIWRFGHGLHARRRFSGRYETILWFTKSHDYTFNLDPVRVPQKYPSKRYYKGPNKGELSGNPRGKNPSDVWDIPNVKSNHIEKTIHPCQFPVELIERLVLSMTNPGDWVLDPFLGVGTSAIAALMHGRRAMGAEISAEYIEIARERIAAAEAGALKIRPMDRAVYDPNAPELSQPPKVVTLSSAGQLTLADLAPEEEAL